MKTEKEKMLAGEIYDAADPELIERWDFAKQLQLQYNGSMLTHEQRDKILDDLLGAHGKNVWIVSPFFVDYGSNIYLGNDVEINMNCVFLDCNRITIGDHCGLGPGVHIYTVGHPVKASERINPQSVFWNSITAPVTIGRNVWIGGGSIILPGVTIGNYSTIGAGSVVTKDIPDNCLAVGNPCKVIRYLY